MKYFILPGNYRNQKTDKEPGRPVFNDTDKIKDLSFLHSCLIIMLRGSLYSRSLSASQNTTLTIYLKILSEESGRNSAREMLSAVQYDRIRTGQSDKYVIGSTMVERLNDRQDY